MVGDLPFTNLKRREYSGRNISHRVIAIFIVLAIIIVLHMPWTNTGHAASTTRISQDQEWRYLKGTENPPKKWNHEEFDDSRWLRGLKGTGYGKKHSSSAMHDMKGNYRRVYARRLFNVNNPQAIVKMSLSVVCDGPFVAYLNGMMMIRNIIGLSTEGPGGSLIGEELDISGWAHELNPGLNVVTIQCDNDDINSNDFHFIPSLNIIEGHNAE